MIVTPITPFQIDQSLKNHDEYKSELDITVTDTIISLIRDSNQISSSETSDWDFKELSNELLVPESKLEEVYKKGNDVFAVYVAKKREKYASVIEEARQQYAKIGSVYRENGDILTSVNSNDQQPISKELMMKMVRQGLLALSKEQTGTDVEIKSKSMNAYNWRVLAGRTSSGNLQLVKWSGQIDLPEKDPNYLGRGFFGLVQKVYNVTDGLSAAMKFSCPKDNNYKQAARDDIIAEGEKLTVVNDGKINEGLQPPAFKTFQVAHNGEVEVGLLQSIFSHGDLFDVFEKGSLDNISRKDALKIAISLFKGLQKLHETAVHGDIKLENCFVSKKENGDWNVVLADLGGAKYLQSEFTVNNTQLNNIKNGFGIGTTATPGYFTETDNSEGVKHYRSKNQEMWENTHKKRDIYATAATLWSAFSGSPPYYTSFTFPRTQQLSNRNKLTQLIGEMPTKILADALNEHPQKRPNIDMILLSLSLELDAIS